MCAHILTSMRNNMELLSSRLSPALAALAPSNLPARVENQGVWLWNRTILQGETQ